MLLALHSKGHAAGKDTVAGFMGEWCGEHNWSFRRIAFGDKAKVLVAHALDHGSAQERDEEASIGLVDEFKLRGALGWVKDSRIPISSKMTGRQFIINLAEGVRVMFGENAWTELGLPWGDQYQRPQELTVVTDVYYPHEATYIHRLGGKVFQVRSPRVIDSQVKSAQGIPENEVDGFVNNNGTPQDLRNTVRGLMDRLAGQ